VRIQEAGGGTGEEIKRGGKRIFSEHTEGEDRPALTPFIRQKEGRRGTLIGGRGVPKRKNDLTGK